MILENLGQLNFLHTLSVSFQFFYLFFHSKMNTEIISLYGPIPWTQTSRIQSESNQSDYFCFQITATK